MTDITLVFEAVFALGWAILLCVIVPALRAKYSAEKLDELNGWVRLAVLAVEQIYNESGMGKQKKDAVIWFLHKKGYTVDEATIDVMIEAAVCELNKGIL